MQRAMRAYAWTPASAGATKVGITLPPDSSITAAYISPGQ